MRVLVALSCALLAGACTQTVQLGTPGNAMASAPTPMVEPAPTETAVAENLPPIYEPLVDMHRVNRARYERDLAVCREQAAPQERAARAAREREAAGTAMAAIGTVASFIPVQTWRQAQVLDAATGTAQVFGASAATEGAITGANATADYALVVNACLEHRGYRLLRA